MVTARRAFHYCCSILVVVSLVVSVPAPAVLAQDSGTSVYLPYLSNGNSVPSRPDGIQVYRTRVEVQTPAQWQTLIRIEPVIIERGDNWALLTVDDVQLGDLARLRFNPNETNALPTLLSAQGSTPEEMAGTFAPILEQLTTMQTMAAADVQALDVARATLRAGLASLSMAQLAYVAELATVDSDSDGLTDDQEGFWCTDPTRADSDYDGAKDGAEVTALKQWMDNELYRAPSTGKPFQGWPPQKTGCYDDDQDSVPDMAEIMELGLNSNRESTDRDKFDDGQELFGQTYCTGQGGYCSYGPLPRNEDWGIIFAEMPSWVKAPGNHPLVAAFPAPEVDVVQSSLVVQPVTEITTEKGGMSQTTVSYGTEVMTGTSGSVTDAETWNNWQEVSTTRPVVTANAELNPGFAQPTIAPLVGIVGGFLISYAAGEIINCVGQKSAQGQECWEYTALKNTGNWINDNILGNPNPAESPLPEGPMCRMSEPITGDYCSLDGAHEPTGQEAIDGKAPNMATQDRTPQRGGTQLRAGASGLMQQRAYPLEYPTMRPVATTTSTQGQSKGGSRAVTHAEYEEHTVTNTQAWTTGENWSTATAVNSAHAADLWFSYRVRNAGTEFAHEVCNLTFNIYIGDDPNPAYSYFVPADRNGACFESLDPGEEHVFSARTNTHAVPLTLAQMMAIDLGGPIRIVVEDFTYGMDELFYEDAAASSVTVAIDDGIADGDELIDAYVIPTWGSETLLDVLARYFPHETDLNGTVTAIWTPEQRSDTPSWCQSAQRPRDQPSMAVWCKHALSTAEWFSIYSNGLGDGGEAAQNTPAAPGAVAFFRFNQDNDLDGFSDLSEARLGTDPNDASSFPKPELLAGLHNIVNGNLVTSTISLLNMGLYDAYGVEALMIAPDDSIRIDDNMVGGSGRVKALKQAIVGSGIKLQSPLPAPWLQSNHALPVIDGYYVGSTNRVYAFTVNCPVSGGCQVGDGDWTVSWTDGQSSGGTLHFGAGYRSPARLAVGSQGISLVLGSGSVQNNESFTVTAAVPSDAFRYTVSRRPYTLPLVIVSYNDPQGSHQFVIPSQAMSVTAPTMNLQPFAGQMLKDIGVEIVTTAPFTTGANTIELLSNNPSDVTLKNAALFVEVVDISGTVVSKLATAVTLPPGPSYTPVDLNSNDFSPAYNPSDAYVVVAFVTDYQGNVIDSSGRPLSSFQKDPLPRLAFDASSITWNFGTVAEGALLKHRLALANTGSGRLMTYMTPVTGLSLSARTNTVGPAELADYQLVLRTMDLPTGAYEQTATLKTSDPTQPALTIHVFGTIAAANDVPGRLRRPLDWTVTVQGPKNQGEWVEFTHTLGPDPQSLHPVKVYSQDYINFYGVGKYATDFGAGTAAYDMFGDGRDGAMPGSGNLDDNHGFGIGIVNGGSAGSTSISVTDAGSVWRVGPGDVVLIHQTQGSEAGCWEFNRAVSDFVGGTATYQLAEPLKCNYLSSGNNHAQLLRIPQYSVCNVTGTVTPLRAWDGATGGIFGVMCADGMNLSGAIDASGAGYRAHSEPVSGSGGDCNGNPSYQGEGVLGYGGISREANATGGGGGLAEGQRDNAKNASGGGGGGHATGGERVDQLGSDPSNCGNAQAGGEGGGLSGNAELTNMTFGGAGGGGGARGGSSDAPAFNGGNGGGIVAIVAKDLNISGQVRSNGQDCCTIAGPDPGSARGGGGAGGSILVRAGAVASGADALLARGGSGGGQALFGGRGGTGGLGRIRIEYCASSTASANPPASTTRLNCYVAEQIESSPFMTGRLNLPANVTSDTPYAVQYGRRTGFTVAGSQTTTLRVPASMFAYIRLSALVSQLTANTNLLLDIGNDGTYDWLLTAISNGTNVSPNLAAVFNAYWASHGAPTKGVLDLPVKVTMSQPGQVLLADLYMTTPEGKSRSLRLPARAISKATLDLALGGSGAQNISVAVDVGANGSFAWTRTLSTTLPLRLTTGDLAVAINAYLAGKSGEVDLPIRVYVTPEVPVALYDANVSYQPVLDLETGAITIGAVVAAAGANAIVEGTKVPVQATIGNPSSQTSGPVTAAFFANAPGWGDWYIGSTFVADIPAGGSTPVNILWDTTGFSGNVPVKVIVNPYGQTPETSTGNNVATTNLSITPLHPLPVVNFSGSPTVGGAPLTVRFTDLTTGTVGTREWNFGDNTTSGDANPVHVYSAMGYYTVTLNIDGLGGSDWNRKVAYIHVTDTPAAPTAEFTSTPTSGVAPLTVQFSDQSSGTITGWQWSFGDQQSSTDQNPSHQYTIAGTYSVSLTVSGPGGSNTRTRQAFITVTPVQYTRPVADFSATPTTGEVPLTVQFTDKSKNPVTGWQWTFGDGQTSTAQNPSHQYTTAGTFDVSLKVSGPGGSNTKTVQGFVTATPVQYVRPTANFTGTPTTGTTPLTVQFTDQSNGTVTGWQWNFGDQQTSTVQNPSHEYTTAGIYDVSLQVSGPGGTHTKTRQAFITVSPAQPVRPTANFTATPTTGTAPLTVQFTDRSQNVVTSWEWTFGDGGSSTERNPQHTYSSVGTYDVKLKVTGPGGQHTATRTGFVVVQPENQSKLAALFTADVRQGTVPVTVQFTDQSSGAITAWQWSFGDGVISTERHPAHTYTTAGTYTVELSISGVGLPDKRTEIGYITVLPRSGEESSHTYLPAVRK